jgi:predicted DNA-binding transcriptional regulator YafY
LVHYGNDWHLVAYCRLRKEMRDFRAGRIREAEVLDERFERLAEADLTSTYKEEDHLEVRVWLEASAVPWAREAPAYGFLGEEQSEGGSVFVYDTRDVRRLLPWLLSWGASARVLSPEDVVDKVRKEAQALAVAYGDA